MKKLFKYVAITLVVLGVLFIGVVVSAYFLIDPNNYQDELTEYVKEKTGRDLKIGGDIEKSIYPMLGVKVPAISLSNPPGFKNKTFFSIKEAQIGVKLIPIFSGTLESDIVRLVGLELNLERNANGTRNWDDLVAMAQKPQKEDKPSGSEKDSGDRSTKDMAFSFQGIELADSSISWTDITNGQKYKAEKINLTVNLEELDKPFDVAFSSTVTSEQPYLESFIDLKTEVKLNKTFDKFRFSDLDLLVKTEADNLPKGGVRINLMSQIDISMPEEMVKIGDLKLQVNDIILQGNTQITQFIANPQISGMLKLEELNPSHLAKSFQITLPSMQSPDALSRLATEVKFSASASSVSIDPIKIIFDETQLDGKVSVSNFAQPSIRFALNADKLNVDNYLPPPSEDAQTTQSEEQSSKEPPDLKALQELDVAGTIKVGEIIAQKLKSTDVKLTIIGKDGKFRVDPLTAMLYQGTLSGNLEFDVTRPEPVIHIKKSLKDFQAGPFTTDLLGKEQINGMAMFDMDFKTTGLTPESIMKNLNGKGNFRFSDGAISGINLGLLLRKAIAKINNKPAPPDEPLSTDFALLEGSFKATAGVISNSDLSLMSPLFRVSGEGDADLTKSSLDYLVVAAVANTTEGQGGKGLEELKDIPVPVRLKGSFTDIKPSIDFDKLYKMLAKKRVDKETKKVEEKARKQVEEKLKDKLGDDAKEKLKGLFGR